jgi:hypothetical protein
MLCPPAVRADESQCAGLLPKISEMASVPHNSGYCGDKIVDNIIRSVTINSGGNTVCDTNIPNRLEHQSAAQIPNLLNIDQLSTQTICLDRLLIEDVTSSGSFFIVNSSFRNFV